MKKISAFLLSLMIVISFSSCEVTSTNEKGPTPYPVQIANVTVEKEPEKVVCLSPSLTEITCELGYEELLIGRTEESAYPETVRSLPSVGKTGHIDAVKLVELAPDAVLSHASLSRKEMETFAEANIQVIVLPMAQSLTELKALYQTLGKLYAGQVDGDEVGQRYYQKITDELEAVKAKLPTDELENGFLYIINPSGVIATGDSFEGSVLSAVFGANAAESGTGYQIDKKIIAANEPSVLFTAEPYGLPHLEGNASYKNLAAVKEKKVASVDNTLFGTQSFRITKAVTALAEALYPELFEAADSSDPSAESAPSVSSGAGNKGSGSSK